MIILDRADTTDTTDGFSRLIPVGAKRGGGVVNTMVAAARMLVVGGDVVVVALSTTRFALLKGEYLASILPHTQSVNVLKIV